MSFFDALVTMSYADMAATVWLLFIVVAFLGAMWVLGRYTWRVLLTFVCVGGVLVAFLVTAEPAPVEPLPAGDGVEVGQ